jgi:hypothetical protein
MLAADLARPGTQAGSQAPDRSATGSSYIRTATFDAALIAVPSITGLAVGAAAVAAPILFPLALIADVWLLGYHHVVATYTRLAFDWRSFVRNRFLALDALILVVALALGAAYWLGPWVIATAFLYLQWFHYMRQGYGISRMYYRTTPAGRSRQARDYWADAVLYAVPIYCIVQRSAGMGDQFLGLPVRAVVMPEMVVTATGLVAAVAVAAWWIRTAVEMARGRADHRYAAFVLSHVAIFLVGYVVIDDVNTGWLAINIWHNLQYVMVVWMVNVKRYAAGIDPQARLLSTISQPNRIVAYFASCVAISTIVYFNLDWFTTIVLGGGLAATLGIYMGINLHHYLVDAMIWRRPAVARG